MMDARKAAFLGLGVMGGPMARWLAAKGHAVAAWNRTGTKADAWAGALPEGGRGRVASSVIEAVAGADIVFACVGDDPDAAEVARAAFSAMREGSVYVDHTTTSARLARALGGEARAHGLHWLDAPVSGGQAGAENARLTAMCGGTEEAFATAKPVMEAYCANIVRIGGDGAGQEAKMANQIAIAGVLRGLSEAMVFAEAKGLDTEAVLAAIGAGAAGSWQMANRWSTMARREFGFGFAVDWMRKDLRIVLEEAGRLDLSNVRAVDEAYARVQAMGGGRWDTSSLITALDGQPE